MARRKRTGRSVSPVDLAGIIGEKLRPPFALILGTSGDWVPFLAQQRSAEVTNYQMDLFPAERLRAALEAESLDAAIVTAPDLWDLPAGFQTIIYAAEEGGERALKIDS